MGVATGRGVGVATGCEVGVVAVAVAGFGAVVAAGFGSVAAAGCAADGLASTFVPTLTTWVTGGAVTTSDLAFLDISLPSTSSTS